MGTYPNITGMHITDWATIWIGSIITRYIIIIIIVNKCIYVVPFKTGAAKCFTMKTNEKQIRDKPTTIQS